MKYFTNNLINRLIMGLITSKAVNPSITDVNDPLYTALNGFGARWPYSGIIGDAMAYLGRGYEQYICQDNLSALDAQIEVGDYVVMGNRSGVVTNFATDSGYITTIEVNEDLRYLPADYVADPASYGYDAGAKKTGRTVTYVMGTSVSAAGIRNGGGSGVFLFTGTLLILRQRTNDMSTWTPEARAAVELARKGLPQLYMGLGSTLIADNNPATTPAVDRVIYFTKPTVAELVIGDAVWLNASTSTPHPDGTYFGGAGFYYNISNGVLIALVP
jgi:hypothetical protein